MKQTKNIDEPYQPLIVIAAKRVIKFSMPKVMAALRWCMRITRQLPKRFMQAIRFLRRQPLLLYGFAVIWLLVFLNGEHAFFKTIYRPYIPAVRDDLIGSGAAAWGVHYSSYLWGTLVMVGALLLVALNVIAIRRHGWRMFAGTANGLVVLVLAVMFQSNMAYWSSKTSAMMNGSIAKPPATLQQAIVTRAQCGDAVQFVNNYGYDSKTFYDMKRAGWHLAANFQSDNGNLNSYQACKTYFNLRETHPSDHIIVQLYREDDGQQLPYYYDNGAASMPGVRYGLFVKE